MKHLKGYNESIKAFLKGKSSDDIKKSLDKLTPYGALYKLISTGDMDIEIPELGELVKKRIKDSENELDKIINNDNNLLKIVDEVAKWVEVNGGNRINITDYGFPELGRQLLSYRIGEESMEEIYDKEVVFLYKQLLKKFAICEVKNNNTSEYL